MQTAAVEKRSRFSASGQKNAECQIFLKKRLQCGRVYGIIIEL